MESNSSSITRLGSGGPVARPEGCGSRGRAPGHSVSSEDSAAITFKPLNLDFSVLRSDSSEGDSGHHLARVEAAFIKFRT